MTVRFEGLDPDLMSAYQKANTEYKKQYGKDLPVTSAVRTAEEQNELRRRAAAGEPGIYMPSEVPKGAKVVHTNALDIPTSVPESFLNKFGLYRTLGKNDPVHTIYRGNKMNTTTESGQGGQALSSALSTQMSAYPSVDKSRAKVEGALTNLQESNNKVAELTAQQEYNKADAYKRMLTPVVDKYERESLELQDKLDSFPHEGFHPTQQNLPEMASIFSAVGILGSLFGGGARTSGMNALAGMTGMMEGWQKGDVQKFNQEKAVFDENRLQQRAQIEQLMKRWERIAKDYSVNKEKATLEADMLIAELGSPLLKETIRNKGLTETLKTLSHLYDSDVKAQKIIDKANQKGEGKATQQQFIAQRAVTALRGVASDLESIVNIPVSSNAGILPYLSSKEGVVNYLKNNAGRNMTDSESKAVQTLFKGVSRNLATIEASGTATGLVGLSKQLEGLEPQPGDKVEDVALKLADIKRISTEAIAAMIESGLMPKQQADAAQAQIERLNKVIPYSTNDVVKSMFGGQETLGQATQAAIKPNREQFIEKARQSNPNATDDELGAYYDKKYGGK